MKAFRRIAELWKQGQTILREQGVFYAVKTGLSFVCTSFIRIQKILIYEKNIGKNVGQAYKVTKAVKLNNLEIHIVKSIKELLYFKNNGYDFTYYTKLEIDKVWLDKDIKLVLVFKDKELLHKSWIAADIQPAMILAPYLKKTEYQENILVIEQTSTNQDFRRQGIYHMVYTYIFNLAQSLNKQKVVYSAEASNKAVINAQNKLNAKIAYSGYHVRLFWLFDFYTVKRVR
jgi:hypothetical protein